MNSEIVMYQTEDGLTISRHIKNIFDEGELIEIQLLQNLQQLRRMEKPIRLTTIT